MAVSGRAIHAGHARAGELSCWLDGLVRGLWYRALRMAIPAACAIGLVRLIKGMFVLLRSAPLDGFYDAEFHWLDVAVGIDHHAMSKAIWWLRLDVPGEFVYGSMGQAIGVSLALLVVCGRWRTSVEMLLACAICCAVTLAAVWVIPASSTHAYLGLPASESGQVYLDALKHPGHYGGVVAAPSWHWLAGLFVAYYARDLPFGWVFAVWGMGLCVSAMVVGGHWFVADCLGAGVLFAAAVWLAGAVLPGTHPLSR